MRRHVLLVAALLLVVAGMGVSGFGLGVRGRGLDQLASTLERQEADGYGASFEELLATAPELEAERQDRLWGCIETWGREGKPSVHSSHVAWYLDGASEVPEADRAWMEDVRAHAEAFRAILGEGTVCLTSLGWLETAVGEDGPTRVAECFQRIPNLLVYRRASRYFSLLALSSEDPAPALDAMDQMYEALGHPACLIDSMIAVALDGERDDLHLCLTLRGALDPTRLECWLDEAPRARDLLADGLRGERLRWMPPLAAHLLAGGSLHTWLGPSTDDGLDLAEAWTYRIQPWFRGASDLARVLDATAAAEGYVRGRVPWPEVRARLAAGRDVAGPFALAQPFLPGMAWMALSRDTGQRCRRVAAVLAGESRRRGRGPETSAEAEEWLAARAGLLAGGPWRLPLLCAPVSPNRVRIAALDDAKLPEGVADDPRSDVPSAPSRPLQALSLGIELRLPTR